MISFLFVFICLFWYPIRLDDEMQIHKDRCDSTNYSVTVLYKRAVPRRIGK